MSPVTGNFGLADDKLIERPRKGAPWQLTEKGEKVLNKDNQ